MPDLADKAQHYMEQHPVTAPANNFDKPSRVYCIDCEDPIPEKRRANGGIERCVDCQHYQENKL